MLEHITSLELTHNGDCHLLGISPDMTLYIEEVYGADGWLAQHALNLDGQVQQSVNEEDDQTADFVPLTLPADLVQAQPAQRTRRLNFSGPRLRGLREEERIQALVRPLTVPTRLKLAQQLDIAAPMLLGIAASYVMAEAMLTPPDHYLVCRRLRIAYAMSQPALDEDHQPYDYDTLTRYVAHLYDTASHDVAVETEVAFAGLPGVDLQRPMDCLIFNQYLIIADGGQGARHSRIHIWQIGE